MEGVAARTRAMVRASHPLPALAVTGVAAGLALGGDRPWWAFGSVVAAVLAGQLSVGWLNDLVDAPRDALVGRADKPVASGALEADVVRRGAVLAAGAAVALSLVSGPAATAAHVVALIAAWAYDLGLKATAISVAPFAIAFGLLPSFVSLGLPGSPLPPLWLTAAAACLGSAAHFVNVLPDLADDAATGVRGLPHRLGADRSRWCAAALVLLASALLVFGPPGPPAALAVAAVPLAASVLAVGLARGRRPGSRSAFTAVMVVALLDVALLVGIGVPG